MSLSAQQGCQVIYHNDEVLIHLFHLQHETKSSRRERVLLSFSFPSSLPPYAAQCRVHSEFLVSTTGAKLPPAQSQQCAGAACVGCDSQLDDIQEFRNLAAIPLVT